MATIIVVVVVVTTYDILELQLVASEDRLAGGAACQSKWYCHGPLLSADV